MPGPAACMNERITVENSPEAFRSSPSSWRLPDRRERATRRGRDARRAALASAATTPAAVGAPHKEGRAAACPFPQPTHPLQPHGLPRTRDHGGSLNAWPISPVSSPEGSDESNPRTIVSPCVELRRRPEETDRGHPRNCGTARVAAVGLPSAGKCPASVRRKDVFQVRARTGDSLRGSEEAELGAARVAQRKRLTPSGIATGGSRPLRNRSRRRRSARNRPCR